MRGRLKKGVSPVLLLTPESKSDEENSLFKKAKPQLEVAFDVVMRPRSAHLHWREAVEQDERIGSGQLNAAFKFQDTTLASLGSVGNFVSRTIITGGQSSKVAHFLYGFSAGFGVCGGGGGGAHA